jgi:hypothetical protein
MLSSHATCLSVIAIGILAITVMLPVPAAAQVSIGISVGFAPPELPVYEQPICPGEGYIWTPGYWGWDPDEEDYYWVPGTWVLAPEVGYLWTPGYWGWGGSAFEFYEGYWGPAVGFYGGINYGYGYFGRGYEGGRWDGGRFYYNSTVNNINVTEIHNVYNTTVINNNANSPRVSFNGGNGGVNVRPTAQEQAAAHERHVGPIPTQVQHVQAARSNPELRASQNRGKPPIAATQRPGAFTGRAVVPAKEGGRYAPPADRRANTRGANNNTSNNPNRPPNATRSEIKAGRATTNANRPVSNAGNAPTNGANPRRYVHPNDLPKTSQPDRPPSAANSRTDQKYQKAQDKMYQKQDQERQRLQQRQDQEHQRAAQQKANGARTQQLEQRHQQQTQQLQQRHEQQQQKMEQRQQPRQQAPPPSEKRPPSPKP